MRGNIYGKMSYKIIMDGVKFIVSRIDELSYYVIVDDDSELSIVKMTESEVLETFPILSTHKLAKI